MAMLIHALVRISRESLRLATAPINRIDPSSDRPMKARIGPVDDTLHQTVLQRISMHVVHVVPVIQFILNQVFPIAPLPDSTLAAGALSCR